MLGAALTYQVLASGSLWKRAIPVAPAYMFFGILREERGSRLDSAFASVLRTLALVVFFPTLAFFFPSFFVTPRAGGEYLSGHER